MAVRALVDLDAVTVPRDEIVAALRPFHVMRLALVLPGGLLRRRALLAEQLGVAAREVFVFVLTRLVVGHGLVGAGAGGGAGGGGMLSVSPPGLGVGARPAGAGRL